VNNPCQFYQNYSRRSWDIVVTIFVRTNKQMDEWNTVDGQLQNIMRELTVSWRRQNKQTTARKLVKITSKQSIQFKHQIVDENQQMQLATDFSQLKISASFLYCTKFELDWFISSKTIPKLTLIRLYCTITDISILPYNPVHVLTAAVYQYSAYLVMCSWH